MLGPTADTWYATFKEVYDAQIPGAAAHVCGTQNMADHMTARYGRTYVMNEMIGSQTSPTYCFANMQIALAAAADSGLAGGSDAWARSQWSGLHPD